jgi:hypothetical protein
MLIHFFGKSLISLGVAKCASERGRSGRFERFFGDAECDTRYRAVPTIRKRFAELCFSPKLAHDLHMYRVSESERG